MSGSRYSEDKENVNINENYDSKSDNSFIRKSNNDGESMYNADIKTSTIQNGR